MGKAFTLLRQISSSPLNCWRAPLVAPFEVYTRKLPGWSITSHRRPGGAEPGIVCRDEAIANSPCRQNLYITGACEFGHVSSVRQILRADCEAPAPEDGRAQNRI